MEAHELNDYREHLLDALEDQPRRAAAERPGLLQIFVNEERVGTLDCAVPDPVFNFASRERSIQSVELRSESGVLIGGCVAPEAGSKSVRLSIGKGNLTAQIQNRFDGGSVHVAYAAAPRWWTQVAMAAGLLPGNSLQAAVHRGWAVTGAFAQIVLALGIMTLLAERVPAWFGWDDRAHQLEEEQAARDLNDQQMDRLHQQLTQLAETQASALAASRTGQEQMTQLSRLVDSLAHGQQKLNGQVASVQDELQTVKATSTQELQDNLALIASKADADRQQILQDLNSIKTVNETLIKQVASLESRNRELHGRLVAASLEMNKANATAKSTTIAEAPKEQPAQVAAADAHRDADPQAFMFWVSFQDGTTDKSIEELIQEIHGTKKGPAKSGWYSVEVNLPHPEPRDRFLESVKRAKIVKAVATSKVMPPAQ
jgi:hypothetical protein